MTLDPTQTVASLANAAPHALPVLERYRIDYCCGGGRRLGDACRKAGLSLDALAEELEAAAPRDEPAVDWTTQPLGALCDHIIERYHRPLDGALPRLRALARKVATVHGPRGVSTDLVGLYRELEALAEDLVQHMRREEQVVFPWVRGERRESAGAAVRLLTEEHEAVGEALRRIRSLAGDYTVPPEACGSWRALWLGLEELERELHAHVHLENNVLFPRALA